MIEVRMLTSMSGDPSCNAGDVITVKPEVAERWERMRICEIVRQTRQSKRKKAVRKPEDET